MGEALITTIHYLQWHRNDPDENPRASDLFHAFHDDPPDTLTTTTFDELYEAVAEVDTDDLEDLYAEWNRGSGREACAFLELRYCGRCESSIEGIDEAITHAARNHGYDAVAEPGEPDYMRGERSMSVGDIVERDNRYYACAPIGWHEVRLIAPDGGTDDLTDLAAGYHRDKLDVTLYYPVTFTSARNGRIRTASFDYFPEYHYRQGFEQLRGSVSDETVDAWIDAVIGSEPVAGTHGGLWRDDIPEMVANLLHGHRPYDVEIEIRPESVPDGYDYLVKWAYIDFDREEMAWKPVNEMDERAPDTAETTTPARTPLPRDVYLEYVEALAETDDLQAVMTYAEWLEAELTEMWDEHGSPYL